MTKRLPRRRHGGTRSEPRRINDQKYLHPREEVGHDESKGGVKELEGCDAKELLEGAESSRHGIVCEAADKAAIAKKRRKQRSA